MNINPTPAAASVAGVSRAVAKGGESEKQATDATNKLAASETPGGNHAELSEIDKGSPTGDRGGDGRQDLDTFEGHDDESQNSDDNGETGSSDIAATAKQPTTDADGHLDFEA
ncbi:hypothetical protein K227x_50550 [Rubripirellula lacrimiformis]|uniref:Uncharacterized protein n=1 Tax=Rubripirellula lacrimiformis TaxID=1930273 RepID=A0A517NHM3_9BACT|nr:hypothetical protein [Rubripirellula lacrimiformis]QDT06639.1 hypothetical protein K227x_50550 [Rubripirellula lacrimiformis]